MKKLYFILSISVLFLGGQGHVAAAKNMEYFTPYYGKGPRYIQPSNIAYLFPQPEIKLQTPAFKTGKVSFTSQEEMLDFLQNLTHKNKNLTLKCIGQSIEGREIPMLIFSKDKPEKIKNDKKKPLVWLQGQIHGSEPAAGESTLAIAQWLTEEKMGYDILDFINVVIIPRINPDGSYYFKRYNAYNQDANRDYMNVEYPEGQIIHRFINEYQPDVVLDAHEYSVSSSLLQDVGENGSIASYDLLISSAKNLNIPQTLRKMSDDLLLQNVYPALDFAKLSHHAYYTLASSRERKLVAIEGGTEAKVGRNALGLKNILTYLIETRGIGIGRADFERRVYGQVVAQSAFLQAIAANAEKIKKVTASARQDNSEKGKKVGDNDKIVITSENKLIANQTLEVVDLAKAAKVSIPINWKSSTEAYPTLERERPTAYVMPPSYELVAQKLQTLGIHVQQLLNPVTVPVESYHVKNKKVKKSKNRGEFTSQVTTKVMKKNVYFPEGSYVFDMGQPNANLIALALEPESVDSYTTFNFIPSEVGQELPVYRYMVEGFGANIVKK
ncbi:peptidase [Bacillus thuringiensis]|uniref:Zinc carboxypeptidase n=1 Tax=Bacillus thuringiensis TaxID=1428 RepID=A0A9W3SJ66_BACTU|nr:M14 family metallocarboxypeptidase [Bacillus thuringiensis]ANS52386.1 zinc carboxypeptidase [Bacillus thuringiensis]MBH0336698.1 peptidase [Bacillus thuringiensis]